MVVASPSGRDSRRQCLPNLCLQFRRKIGDRHLKTETRSIAGRHRPAQIPAAAAYSYCLTPCSHVRLGKYSLYESSQADPQSCADCRIMLSP